MGWNVWNFSRNKVNNLRRARCALLLKRYGIARREFCYEAGKGEVYEAGKDTKNNVYFAYLNGVVRRFSRKEFIKYAKENEAFALDILNDPDPNMPTYIRAQYREYLNTEINKITLKTSRCTG